MQASDSHLDVGRAPYVLYGVKYIDLVSRAILGDAAPPWADVPEVRSMTRDAFNTAKCNAAKKLGALAPIDI